MPIGKNAIKRVTGNGYSKVNTSAPDMENSEVVKEKSEVVIEKVTPPSPAPVKAAPKATKRTVKKAAPASEKAEKKATSAPKKAAEKASSTPKKSMEAEPDFSPVKTAEKITAKQPEAPKRQGNGYVNLGGELPYYLL